MGAGLLGAEFEICKRMALDGSQGFSHVLKRGSSVHVHQYVAIVPWELPLQLSSEARAVDNLVLDSA